jgi:hypothetical protein
MSTQFVFCNDGFHYLSTTYQRCRSYGVASLQVLINQNGLLPLRNVKLRTLADLHVNYCWLLHEELLLKHLNFTQLEGSICFQVMTNLLSQT